MFQYEELTSTLTARLHEMQNRVAQIEDDICAPGTADLYEQALLDADDQQLKALNEAGLAELNAIQASLARIGHGTYGVCIKCDIAIHVGRLEAMPTAALCIDCATDADQLQHKL